MTMVTKSLAVFFVSMIPLVEGKGAVLLAKMLKMPLLIENALAIIGSYIPVPFLLYTEWGRKVDFKKQRKEIPERVRKYVQRYGCWALLVIISVPFTGVGCWLSAIMAHAMHMDKHKAAVCIFIGNAIAIILMSGCITGIIAAVKMLIA